MFYFLKLITDAKQINIAVTKNILFRNEFKNKFQIILFKDISNMFVQCISETVFYYTGVCLNNMNKGSPTY